MNSPEELMEESTTMIRADSRASRRSRWSADRPIDFKGLGNVEVDSMKTDRPSSPGCASERSDWSADRPIDFRRGEDVEAASVRTGRPNSPGSASERSGWSEERPIDFRGAKNPEAVSVTGRSVGDSGIVSERSSMTSDWSKGLTLNISHEEHTENPRCAEPGDVVCDLCEGTKSRAYKSCMTCLASFCERHIRDHYTVEPLQRHLLVEVTKNLNILQENAQLRKENTSLKEKNKALNQKIHELRLPDYICKGKIPAPADLTLDSSTAYSGLSLSKDKKRVRLGERKAAVDQTANRFDKYESVLATEGFSSGRHYWEVEVNREFTIGVTRESAHRRGKFIFSPSVGYWCLYHYRQAFTALEEPSRPLPIDAVPRALGVCVDVEERWVTFYNAETKALIYTFRQMDFADGERIYPVFSTLEKSADLKIKTVK